MNFVFWRGLNNVLLRTARMLTRWRPMLQQETGERIEEVVRHLEVKASSPPQLIWINLESSLSESVQSGAQLLDSTL